MVSRLRVWLPPLLFCGRKVRQRENSQVKEEEEPGEARAREDEGVLACVGQRGRAERALPRAGGLLGGGVDHVLYGRHRVCGAVVASRSGHGRRVLEAGGDVSEGEQSHRESEGSGAYGEVAKTVPVDLKAQQRELEAAGWQRLERVGKLVWRNPRSGHLYPQGAAISLIRAGKLPGASEESGEERGGSTTS